MDSSWFVVNNFAVSIFKPLAPLAPPARRPAKVAYLSHHAVIIIVIIVVIVISVVDRGRRRNPPPPWAVMLNSHTICLAN